MQSDSRDADVYVPVHHSERTPPLPILRAARRYVHGKEHKDEDLRLFCTVVVLTTPINLDEIK